MPRVFFTEKTPDFSRLSAFSSDESTATYDFDDLLSGLLHRSGKTNANTGAIFFVGASISSDLTGTFLL